MMKHIATFLVLIVVLLSSTSKATSSGDDNSHKAWNLCKGKKIHNAPFYCKQPECSQLCGDIHPSIRGFGSCRNEVCQCLFFCPANKNLRKDFIKANKLSNITKLPKMSSSSSSSSSSSPTSKHIKKP
ncbi:uncharacterized protein LOC133037451 [Cannabis sativa]|uniref:uncharacterized protein LOC133037451 n=1 Tax=Cannabis sativa TaxID=3483 RepID=UPI0029CA026D|nr:uncharacterized protein LOC133037451 [Cannabis sativa]